MPTLIGLAIMAIGSFLLVTASIEAMFAFVMLTTLMIGSAAIQLGQNSILPGLVALGFLFVRMLVPGARQMPNLKRATISNSMLLVFAAYVVIGAFTLPRIFAHSMMVIPLRPNPKNMLAKSLIQFGMQNVTTALYTTASCVMALLAYVAGRQPRTAALVPVIAAVAIGIHAFFGITDALFGSTAYGKVIAFFRNAQYAQVEQTAGGFVRFKGICPEPSAFASVGLAWFVFATELWMRDLRPRLTGPAAALMCTLLVLGTSSTGYVGLAAYSLLLIARSVLVPGAISVRKAFPIGAFLLLGAIAICVLLVSSPLLAQKLTHILRSATIDKGQSSSGEVRLMAAQQGLDAFRNSFGLGMGAGSFRSSSLATAILGSAGLIGGIAYLLYILHVLKPTRRSTYVLRQEPRTAIGAAAAWTIIVQTAAASVSAGSSDPGLLTLMFAGLSLGLRSAARSAVRRRPSTPAFGSAPQPELSPIAH